MDELKRQIEEHSLRSLYLFYGEETYLLETYRARVLKSLMQPEDEMMNFDELLRPSGALEIINSAETLPFAAERRLVIVRDSHAFELEGAGNFGPLYDFFASVPDTTVLIFIESHVDKRSRLYKALQKYGQIVEFTPLSEADLIKWTIIEARRRKLRIDGNTAQYFIRTAGTDMHRLHREMEKLFSYKEGTGIILREDVDSIVTPSLEDTVFHMMDALGSRQAAEAFRIYRNLLRIGENAYMIFALLRRQIDILYKTSVYMSERYDAAAIAEAMKIRPFAARKNMAQARKFPASSLRKAMTELLDYDTKIKNGLIKPEQAIELMLARYGTPS